ncbi:MAG: hypothetical protein ACRDQ7_26195 [Haloechinothrix sp.]
MFITFIVTMGFLVLLAFGVGTRWRPDSWSAWGAWIGGVGATAAAGTAVWIARCEKSS